MLLVSVENKYCNGLSYCFPCAFVAFAGFSCFVLWLLSFISPVITFLAMLVEYTPVRFVLLQWRFVMLPGTSDQALLLSGTRDQALAPHPHAGT